MDGPRGIDAAAKKHDISYFKANDYGDIRRADKKLVEDIASSTSSRTMKNIAIGAIRAKNFGEDIGILSKDAFIAQKRTQQTGYGPKVFAKKVITRKKKKVYPAQVLQRLQRKNAKK